MPSFLPSFLSLSLSLGKVDNYDGLGRFLPGAELPWALHGTADIGYCKDH